jgi:hypothetical protein
MTEAGRVLAKRWVDAGTIVLDHHRGAADLVAMFGRRGVFADEANEPGVSGAVLAFREVWSAFDAADRKAGSVWANVAMLAGIRDTWQRTHSRWHESCCQAAALMFWPWEKLLAAGIYSGLREMMGIGEVLLARDFERDTRTLGEAYRFVVDSFDAKLSVLCFEGTHTSDIADRVDEDLIIGWHYLVEQGQKKIVFSTRSRGTFSCLEFAKANGGGGHQKAAGFKLAEPGISPYDFIEQLVRRHWIRAR